MSKVPYIPLTINRAATKVIILEREKTLKLYARRKRIPSSTLIRILLDGISAYPYQVREKSAFQKVLRKMKADGYLVEIENQPLDEAA